MERPAAPLVRLLTHGASRTHEVLRFFFNVAGGGYAGSDAEGTVLGGPGEASDAAVVLAGELLRDADGRFWAHPRWHLTVTDERAATVCTLTIQGARSHPRGRRLLAGT